MKHITPIIGLGTLLLAIGCSTTGSLPRTAQVVGGGLQIQWEAPAEGTVILIEKTTQKTVATKSLSEGDSFQFDVSRESDASVLSAVFPTIPSNAHFVLYFTPAPKKE